MSKHSSSSPIKPLSLLDRLDSSWIEWVDQNKKNLLFGFLAFFAVLVISYRFAVANNRSSQGDFYQIHKDFERLQSESIGLGTNEEGNNLNQIETILNRHPDLHAKYDGSIAQALIIAQQPEMAKPFAEKAFLRLKNEPINFYEDFAQTSLLISAGQYEQALKQAKFLKEQLDQGTAQNFGGTLYLFNLIRIASLHKQLGESNEELKAWEDLEQYKGGVDSLLALHQLFREGNTSLSHYTDYRTKTLKANH